MPDKRSSFQLTYPAWCALVCGLAASCLLFFSIQSHQQQLDHDSFARRTLARTTSLEQGVNHALEALRVVNQFFVTSGSVSREQFHSFTQALLLRNTYIDTFVFSRLVSRAELPAFEAQLHTSHPGFALASMLQGKHALAADRQRYQVADYVEFPAGKSLLFSPDGSPQNLTDAAIRRADDTGLPAAMALFRRPMDVGVQSRLRVIMALYQSDGKAVAAPADIAERRRTVIGYTVAVIDYAALFEKILVSADAGGNAGLNISIYAPASAEADELVYASASQALRTGWSANGQTPASHVFDVAGAQWRMAISAQPVPFFTTHAGALTALLVGLLLTFTTSAYLHSSAVRVRHIKQLVARRTDELKQVNVLLTRDLNARHQVEEALRKSRSDLRKLANYKDGVKEDERKRIARDIHDELGQNLVALRIDVSLLAQHPESLPATRQWADCALQQIDVTIKSLRNIINDLRPAVLDLGLRAALEWQAQEFGRRSGIICELQIDNGEFKLNDMHATVVFRIVQEALTNILKHAKASHVQIRMQRIDGCLFVKISDDGIGRASDADQPANSFGLVGMAERIYALGGNFSIASMPGAGLTIALSIPLDAGTSMNPA
ncbi:MAG: signal transduction histidine kinase [Janthinobacterium sp.]|jgi:signal transduction histidine kinase